MRKLILPLLFAGALSAQALYDFTPVTTSGTFTGTGSAVQNFVIEGRLKADSNGGGFNYYYAGPSMYCWVDANPFLTCGVAGESGGNPNYTATLNTTYRMVFVHNYSTSQVTLVVWSDDCSTKLFSQTQTISGVTAATISGGWAFGHDHRSGFWRFYSGLTGSSNGGLSCPVDRPTTVGTVMDYPFEDGIGAGGSLADRSGNQPSITVASPSYATSTTYVPAASIAWAANVPKPVARVGVPYTFTSTSFASTWPGTGVPNTFSWSAPAGCSLSGTATATLTATCPSAGSGTVGLTVTDAVSAMGSASVTAGIVQTDANGCVTFSNADYYQALVQSKCLPVLGSTSWPGADWAATGDASLLGNAISQPITQTAGSGTVTIPCSGINSCPGGIITASGITQNGVLYNGVAIQGSGSIFTAADAGSYIAINWTVPGGSAGAGRMVVAVLKVDTVANVLIIGANAILEPAASLSSPMTWSRLTPGAGSCSSVTASTSGGQVTGFTFTSCTGFHYYSAGSRDIANYVILSVPTGSGCSVGVIPHGPGDTSNPALYGVIDSTSSLIGTALPCGTGYTGTPSVTATAFNDYDPWDGGKSDGTYDYYAGVMAVGRIAAQTNLPEYTNAWHYGCSTLWIYGTDNGYKNALRPRQAGLLTSLACATDPNWSPPISRNAVFAGVAQLTQALCNYNPSVDLLVGSLDVREAATCLRSSAGLARLGNTYGGIGTTWGGYAAAQLAHIWTPNIVNPAGDSTVYIVPENLWSVNAGFPAAGTPPGSLNFGTSPWRDQSLVAIALSETAAAFSYLGGYSSQIVYINDAIPKLMLYVVNYGTAPDGGTFYDSQYQSAWYDANNITWNAKAAGTNNGSITVSASTAVVGNGTTHFLRRFWTGAKIVIVGVTYTVASVTDDTHLTLTGSYMGTPGDTADFGNACTITVTHGNASITGSADCKFTVMFGGSNPYVGIMSSDAGTTATVSQFHPEDALVYAVTPNSDTTATLNAAFLGCNATCAGSGNPGSGSLSAGTYTSFVYVPQSSTNCGASLSTYCHPDDYNGRNLSQDLCEPMGLAYQITSLSYWLNQKNACLNKQYGWPAGGPGTTGTPSGRFVDAHLGTVTINSGSNTLHGSGTSFLAQFPPGSTLILADSDNSSWVNYPGSNPTYYALTVSTVTNDGLLTLTSNWQGSSITTGTGLFYNPSDPQWQGADGGTGILASTLYPCSYNSVPCQSGNSDFDYKYGKSLGMGYGFGNVPMAMGITPGGVSPEGSMSQFSAKGFSAK